VGSKNAVEELKAVEAYVSAANEATRGRDKAIVAARARGASLRSIAEAAHLTAQGVAKIIERDTSRNV
jgi:hypothetical protein